MSLTPVAEALRLVLDPIEPIGDVLTIGLEDAAGRVLAHDIVATRDQPPFPASAMDGYAVRARDVRVGEPLRLAGRSVAGKRFVGTLGADEAVRIFTGAPVPEGADAILIQENARTAGDAIVPTADVAVGRYLRPAGLDFGAGETLIVAGSTLDPGRLALIAAANQQQVVVRRTPRVALVATGDELVPVGSTAGPDEIVASSVVGVVAMLRDLGAEVFDAGIAPDDLAALDAVLGRALSFAPDLVITLGGASVGEHDLVSDALRARGVSLSFERIAMRPGKPLMHARDGVRSWLGLPGNPVSSLVCTHLFALPLVARFQGRNWRPRTVEAVTADPLGENDERQDYLRVMLRGRDPVVAHLPDRQDSSQLTRFAAADGLLVRPPFASPASAGTRHEVVVLREWGE